MNKFIIPLPEKRPTKRIPWNKGKLIGPKPPLRLKHVWSVRTRLQLEGHARDLALFNLAIDRLKFLFASGKTTRL